MNNHETNPESTTATDPLADIAFSVRQIPARTDGFMDESSRDDPGRTHWKYSLQRGCHKLTGQFSQGSAHRLPPTLNVILSCLIMDADGADALTFEEWCSNFGYDTDSRKAERIFNECRRIAVLLPRILPREHWNTYRDG